MGKVEQDFCNNIFVVCFQKVLVMNPMFVGRTVLALELINDVGRITRGYQVFCRQEERWRAVNGTIFSDFLNCRE